MRNTGAFFAPTLLIRILTAINRSRYTLLAHSQANRHFHFAVCTLHTAFNCFGIFPKGGQSIGWSPSHCKPSFCAFFLNSRGHFSTVQEWSPTKQQGQLRRRM